MPSKKVIFIELKVNVLRIFYTLAFNLMLCMTSRFCNYGEDQFSQELSLVLCFLSFMQT